MGMPPKRQEGLLRAVAGGGQAVRAEADPGQEGNQGNVLPRLPTERIKPLAQQGFGDLAQQHAGHQPRLIATADHFLVVLN
jgi:hypothetical protein